MANRNKSFLVLLDLKILDEAEPEEDSAEDIRPFDWRCCGEDDVWLCDSCDFLLQRGRNSHSYLDLVLLFSVDLLIVKQIKYLHTVVAVVLYRNR
jgi:hypothetical protein